MAQKIKGTKPSDTGKSLVSVYILFFSLIVLLPLVHLQTVQDQTLMPRLLFLTLILLGYTLYTYLSGSNQRAGITLNEPLLIAGTGYLIVSVVSMLFAANPGEGVFEVVKTGLTLLLISILVQQFSRNSDWFVKLSAFIIVSSFIALTIGYYQYFTKVAGNPAGKLADGREIIYAVRGLMGHKNEFASYLMLMLPFSIVAALHRKGTWKILASISAFATVLLLFLLGTRAVWVGLFAGGFVVWAALILSRKQLGINKSSTKKILLIGSVTVALLAAGTLEGGKWTNNDFLKKLGSVVRPSESNNHFRLDIWKITTEMAIENPVTGVGAGNWQIRIPEYYKEVNLRGRDVNWIAPHNDFLWILSEKGFAGLIMYLAMLGFAFLYFFRILKSSAPANDKRVALALFAGLIAYLAVACFDFPYQRIDHQVMFAILIAGIIATHKPITHENPLPKKERWLRVPVLLFLTFSLVYSYQALSLETRVKKGILLSNSGSHNEALNLFGEAETPLRKLDAKGSPIGYYEGMVYSKMDKHDQAIMAYERALVAHPNHIAVLNNLGKSYFSMGNYGQAERYYLRALNIVPSYKEARVNLSTLYYTTGKYMESYEMLKGIKGGNRIPGIRKNREALEKMLNLPSDTSKGKKIKDKKAKDKKPKKDRKKQQGF